MIDDDGLLTRNGVAERYAIHPKTVTKLVADGKLPKPLEGWPGEEKRWLRSEIVAHLRGLRKREQVEEAR